jgi:hypothetical protein
MSRLLGEEIPKLQAFERDLQARLAKALQTWQPPDDPADDSSADADGSLP